MFKQQIYNIWDTLTKCINLKRYLSSTVRQKRTHFGVSYLHRNEKTDRYCISLALKTTKAQKYITKLHASPTSQGVFMFKNFETNKCLVRILVKQNGKLSHLCDRISTALPNMGIILKLSCTGISELQWTGSPFGN